MSLEDSGDKEVEIVLTDTLLFSKDEKVEINWDPFQLRQSINDITSSVDDVEIDIKVFEINKDNYESNEIGVVASRLPNTGSATIMFSELDIDSSDDVRQIVLFIQPLPAPGFKRFADIKIQVGRWTAMKFLVKAVTSVWKYEKCQEWIEQESPSVGQEILEEVRREFPCPPTLDLALNEGTLTEDNIFNRYIVNPIFHPEASNCFRQRDGLE